MIDKTTGITGGIGSGKSVVARVLRCNGFYVYDCDSEAKFIMAHDEVVKKALVNKLGDDIFLDNKLNKAKLSGLIFNNAEVRTAVNEIVHKAVRTDILNKRRDKSGHLFIESAILATGGLTDLCDEIWVIESSRKEREFRLAQRDKISIDEICKRIESQNKEMSLLKNNDVIIIKNESNHPMLTQILKLTDKYKPQQTHIILC